MLAKILIELQTLPKPYELPKLSEPSKLLQLSELSELSKLTELPELSKLPMKGQRIDKLLVERGLAASRTRAQALVMAGVVLVDEQRVAKPSELFDEDASIRVKGADDPSSRYVGRGGSKLEAALQTFEVDVKDLVCLDIGASTGGFTDCLLQRGARRVVAIDVGHNQLDWRLRSDDRVESREGFNARYAKPDDFDESFDLVVMDVSFISASKILPAVVPLLKTHGLLILLIKPQFEVGRGEVGKGGIVTDPAKHSRVIDEINSVAIELGLRSCGVIESPLRGADGNVEFLALFNNMAALIRPTIPEDVPQILSLIDGIFKEYDCTLDAQNEDVHLLNPGPYFRERGGDFWVVENDGAILATVAVMLHDDVGELKALYVHPSLRKHGWGRRLSELVIDYARAASKSRIILWSDTRFTDAHRLYRKLGFHQIGKRDLHDSNNTIEYGFEMSL